MSRDTAPSVLEVLKQARLLIDTPEKWCRGAPRKAGAVCLMEAVHLASFSEPGTGNDVCRAIARVTGERFPARFNDAPETSHGDIIAAFDCAIELASAEGAVNHD